MSVTTYGTPIIKNAVRIPDDMLTESAAGSEYMIKIQTKGVSNPKETLDLLKSKLKEKFGVTVVYGEVANNNITLQIKSSVSIQFVWGAVLVFLPQILSIVGVVVALISVYLVVSSIPTWVYGLASIALVLLFALPKVLPKILPTKGD